MWNALLIASAFIGGGPPETAKPRWSVTPLPPMWHPVGYSQDLPPLSKKKVWLYDEPFLLYRSPNKSINLIYDKCPHQGASLAHGSLEICPSTAVVRVVCPYHGFSFENGKMVGDDAHIEIPNLPLHESCGTLFAIPTMEPIPVSLVELVPLPHFPPEEKNPSFRKIDGAIHIKQDPEIVTENVLDMLHISYVHSFGNTQWPFPSNVRFRKMDQLSGRTRFEYKAGQSSLSRLAGGADTVVVQNEYHLPTTTITRVIAGGLIKTVMTRAMHVGEGKTLLFWTVYRNFWRGNFLSSWVGDIIMRIFMEKTLFEDVELLKHVYADRQKTFCTPYDVTILNYRRAKAKIKRAAGAAMPSKK